MLCGFILGSVGLLFSVFIFQIKARVILSFFKVVVVLNDFDVDRQLRFLLYYLVIFLVGF